jgi:hypothetical protein
MPSPDAPTELNAALREPEEKRTAREKARADLEGAIAVAQRGLMAQSGMLFPAIEQFLASPSEEGWQRVLHAADRVRAEIDRGFDAALDYDGRYGGLLAQPQQIRLARSDASRALSAPPMDGAFTSVLPAWQTRALVLRQPPNPAKLEDVRAWRERLQRAHQVVRDALEPIAARLRVQT